MMIRPELRFLPNWSPWCIAIALIASFLPSAIAPSLAVGQITTNTALPIGRGNLLVRAQTKLSRSTGDPTNADRRLDVLALPWVLVYGATPRLTIFGVVPVLFKTLDVKSEGGRVSRDNQGLGDVRLFARYTVYQLNRRGLTFRIAPFAGAKLPTGSTSGADAIGLFPRPFQLGTGTWDPYVGLVVTRQSLAWQGDASLSYLLGTQGGDYRPGSVGRLDVAVKARVFPRRLERALPHFIYLNLETNLIWNGKARDGGASNPDSGGTSWFLAPGAQFVTRRLILEAAIQIPVIQELNGTALKNDFIATLSGRITF